MYKVCQNRIADVISKGLIQQVDPIFCSSTSKAISLPGSKQRFFCKDSASKVQFSYRAQSGWQNKDPAERNNKYTSLHH